MYNMMKYKIIISFLACVFACSFSFAQGGDYQLGCVGFYNLENLFDPADDPEILDEEFTPNGSKNYTQVVYESKLKNLAKVISQVAKEDSPDGLSVLGVCEIENRKVLEDLVADSQIKNRNYQIVHFQSPDFRGIDCALLYNPKYFKVKDSKALPVLLKMPDGEERTTRDILWVYGDYLGEPMHFFVNHWPSRRGGEEASAPHRANAAGVARAFIDSLQSVDPNAKIMLMGDLNDDPISPSVALVMKAKQNLKDVDATDFYNPWHAYYKKGIGTLAYRDAWNLFDQVIVSKPFTDKKQDGFFLHKPVIFSRDYLIQKSGRYKGYPFRTYDFNIFMNGYSDHFPVYVVLLRKQ